MNSDSPQIALDIANPARARRIRVGVGGWTYEPWRSNFYPPGFPPH